MAQPAAGHHARDHHLDYRLTIITAPARLPYIDWLRGVAILIMIGAHTFDAWTLPAERVRPWYGRIVIIAGMAAPLFLFLAGVGLALSAAGRLRKGQTDREASSMVQRRGWQVFGYAFLFRLQSFVLGAFASPSNLLKVDILNVMGPAIALAGALWGMARSRLGKAIWLSATAIVIALATPLLRGSPILDALPDPLEWYFQPSKGRGTFTMLPWSAFVFAGAVLGTAIDGSTERLRPLWFQAAVAASGAALFAGGVWSALQPALFPGAYFWTTSPAYVAVRVGLMLAVVALAWLWTSRPWRARDRSSPLEIFGTGSLFVYWVHVELVYGFASRTLRRQLTLEQGVVAWLAMSAAMYLLLLGWNRLAPWRRGIRNLASRSIKSTAWTQRAAQGH
jgi:uncharacterized membrane protein